MNDEIEVEEKTEFTFDELSDEAKDKALDAERYSEGYLSYAWWDSTYQEAVTMAAILGIEISTTRHTPHKGKPYYSTDISFSGFSSQGDGASFEGSYAYKADAVQKITNAAPMDKELLRIATALTMMGMTQRLLGLESIRTGITVSGHYSHSATMNLSYDDDDVPEAMEKDLLRLMRDFADWIYNQLENEYDHLMSDDVVAGALEDQTFDESGAVI